ncbi:hydroxyacylglutathione hydrolase C-terminal domain-containing protein [Polaromonas sp.]|uniref:hydroxyacylglutathione hydrolase C-terminal domain-containing protein n=1 Tax=Polaromonas sp. TaxID=1869339 RepID=UPI0017EC6384|nr:hydroxyacylglutathione hydrolase C-terminal domain-containing protein [Polaromonas sp.]NMM04951.1 hypothetical protein [Polaromonas sp.]
MYLIPVPAFADNYLWLLHDGKRALVVDPAEAPPVLRIPAQLGLHPESILVTHHHADYTGGVYAGRERQVSKNPVAERVPYRLPAVKQAAAKFAQWPDQKRGRRRLRAMKIAQNLLVNPFLRTRQASIMEVARRFDASTHDDNIVFAAIRHWKNQFK